MKRIYLASPYTLDGWKESRGINAERNQAVICGLPFTFVEAE